MPSPCTSTHNPPPKRVQQSVNSHFDRGNRASGVLVAVMEVRVVRVLVGHPLVAMSVGMGFAAWIVEAMRMLMMNVVKVPMLVLDGLVLMLMLMNFKQVQPHTDCHQNSAPMRLAVIRSWNTGIARTAL
jgi:hypothetical protein